MIRYRHGFLHGGVYRDEDVQFLVPPERWQEVYNVNADLVIGVEFPRPVGQGEPGCCLQFVQWAFAARAGSPILKEAARTAQRNILRGATASEAVTATGPVMFTRVVLDHLTEFNLTTVEQSGAVYVAKHGERVAVLPYRAFGIHPLHKNVNRGKLGERLLSHKFKGRWKKS